MDNEVTPIQKTVQEALAGVPEEVQSFMWGSDYDAIIKAIQQALSLTDEQTTLVQTDSYALLMQLETVNSLRKKWTDRGMSDELAVKILYFIDTEIISRARGITEYFSEDEEFQSDTPSSMPTKINDSLADLATRLSQPSAIAPVKRDYSIASNSTPSTTSTPAQKSFDPYRELPEK